MDMPVDGHGLSRANCRFTAWLRGSPEVESVTARHKAAAASSERSKDKYPDYDNQHDRWKRGHGQFEHENNHRWEWHVDIDDDGGNDGPIVNVFIAVRPRPVGLPDVPDQEQQGYAYRDR